jgi:hypothetical protein
LACLAVGHVPQAARTLGCLTIEVTNFDVFHVAVNYTDSGANVVNSGDTLVGAAGGVIEVARTSLIRLPHDNGVRSKGCNLVSLPTDLKGRDRPVHDVTGVLLPALFEKGGVGSVQRAPIHLIVAKIFPKRAGLKVRDRFGKRGSATPAGPLRVKVPVVVWEPVVRVAG